MALRNETMNEYTIEDIYELPEGERAELIDGEMYMMALPLIEHQVISGDLFYQIKDYIKSKGGECKVFAAPFAVYIDDDRRSYLEPDICVICDSKKLDRRGCSGAPDWILEIVSPSSRRMDYMLKLFKYQQAGVREYWIVDAEKNKITVYNFETENMDEYTFSDKVRAGIYEDLEIDFSEIEL